MENGNIRDFGETKEDPIDSISNDGSTSRTLKKNKMKDSNSASDIIAVAAAAAAAVNNTTGNSATGSTINGGVINGTGPDSQLGGDAMHGKKNHQQQIDEQQQQQQGESGQGIQQPVQGDGGLGASEAVAASNNDANSQNPEMQAKRKGCDKCGKKFGITGGYSCRCGGTFCAFHRYSDRHDCNFDYREMGADQIRRDNPLVVPEKLRKV